MDVFTFIANIVRSISWPLCIIIIVIILREPIARLIMLIQKIKYKDLELLFNHEINKMQAKAPIKIAEKSDELKLLDLAEKYPRAAILESWMRVEKSAKDAIEAKAKEEKISISTNNFKSPLQIEQKLVQSEILNSEQREIFSGLRKLRNEAVHSPEFFISSGTATDYVGLANTISSYLIKK